MRKADKLGIGILGCGKMGRVYLDWFSQNPHCQIVGVWNRTRERAVPLAQQYDARLFADWRELIRCPEIDAVGICSPSHFHREQVIAAAEARRHILCEKPMANNPAECEEMVRAAKANGVTLMVGFQMRFHPVVRAVESALGKIGKIFHLDFVFGLYRPGVGWRHSLLQGGGVLKELGCHLFDLARHWVGEVRVVTAQTRIIEAGREVEDYASVLLEFESEAAGFLYNTYCDRRAPAIFGNILGLQGQIEFALNPYEPEANRASLITAEKRELSVKIPERIDKVYPGHLDSFGREIDHFVDCLLREQKPVVNGIEGKKAMELVCAAYESQRRGGKIELPLTEFDADSLCFPKFER